MLAVQLPRPDPAAASCRSSASCSSCRFCCSPDTQVSSPTSTASARCSSSPSRSRLSQPALGLVAFLVGHLELTYAVLFLIALQATFFSPAKYGILPEMLPDTRFVARQRLARDEHVCRDRRGHGARQPACSTSGTTASGSSASSSWRSRSSAPRRASAFRARQPRRPARRLSWNPWSEIGAGLKRLLSDRVLCQTVIGNSYFWFLGALLQLVMILFGADVMGLSDRWVGILTTFAADRDRCRQHGRRPAVGRQGRARTGADRRDRHGHRSRFCCRDSGQSFALAAFNLTMVGFFGGLFAVPLNALLQQRSGDRERGRVMAINNFLNMVGDHAGVGRALAVRATSWSCRPIGSSSCSACVTLFSSVYVLAIVPEFLIRFSLWLLTHTVYRIRIVGQEHVPSRGPALLVCNHVSLVDGFLVGVVRPAVRPLPRLQAVLRPPGVSLAAEDDEGDSDRGRQQQRLHGVARARARGAQARTRRVHLRRRVDQPDRQPAAVQARVRADRRGARRPGDSGLSGSRVGQHLQLQGRTVLLEVAVASALSRDGRVWRAHAAVRERRRSRVSR